MHRRDAPSVAHDGLHDHASVALNTVTAPASKANVCTITTEDVVTRTVPY